MKYFKSATLFILMVSLNSCKKESTQQAEEQWNIMYELQTEVTGFSEMRYVIEDGSQWGKFTDWSISSTGTMQKKVLLKTGMLAEFRGEHPTSDKWKLIIKDKNGNVLKQTTTINQLASAPFSYFANISVEIQ